MRGSRRGSTGRGQDAAGKFDQQAIGHQVATKKGLAITARPEVTRFNHKDGRGSYEGLRIWSALAKVWIIR